METKKLKVVSLFSGYGTQELALKYLGVDYENVANCDNFKYANECYDVLHTTTYGNLGDIKEVNENTFPDCDLVTYSFPCQDISISGVQRGIQQGTRSGLLFEVERILSVNKPKYLLMENVKNLVSHNHIDNFKNHIEYLKTLGYSSYWRVLNGADFGCPQNRERVFIIGVRDDKDNDFRWAKEEHLTKRLKDVLKNEVDAKYFLSDKSIQGIINSDFNSKSTIIQDQNNYCATLLSRDYKDPKCVKINSAIKKGDVWVADYRADEGLRIRKDNISPCMTSSMRDGKEWNPKAGTRNPPLVGNNNNIRRLTPRECFRLMDFPDTFTWICSDSQAYKQAGNSIVVRCLELIIKQFNL